MAFIFPTPSTDSFFNSASDFACTSFEPRCRISTFIIFAIAPFAAPSAPWQRLHVLS